MTFPTARFFRVLILFITISLMVNNRVMADFYSTKMVPSSYQNLGAPKDMVYLEDGSLWFADLQNSRIVKVNSSGQVIRTVGRQGTGEGEFDNQVVSITRDEDGFLYVLTYVRLYKLDFNGGYIDSWLITGEGSVVDMGEPNVIHYSA